MRMIATIEATALRLKAKAKDAASLAPVIEKRALTCGPDDVVVEVKAAGVNPSDVKAATGLMPYAVFPRTPGRDFAGVVIDGPPEWLPRAPFVSPRDPRARRNGSAAPVSARPEISASAATAPTRRIWLSKRRRWSRNQLPTRWRRPP